MAGAAAVAVAAQTAGRIATTADALLASPFFFHGKQIVVRHPFETATTGIEITRLSDTARPVFVFWRERPARSEGEVRGEFWDLGRVEPGDSRFATYDFKSLLESVNNGQWPGREQMFVIVAASLAESPTPQTPTLRSIALSPQAHEGRGVTVVGRFRGANLYGDLPKALGKSKWDFILQSADAAVWVSGVRPRGKDLDLDPTARVDTGRWVEVTGIVRREGEAVWIASESVRAAAAPAETPVEITLPPVPREGPPTVIFSAPVQDDTDVERGAPVRIQFSRDMNARSFRDAVRVSYAIPAGAQAPAAPTVSVTYFEGNRSLEIKFAQPTARFQTVKVELLGGITAVDGQPLAPWTLTYSTGGS